MRRFTRRDALRTVASLGGLGSVGLALRDASAATPTSGASQRISRYEIIPARVPMHERIRDVFAAAYRKQGIFRDYYDSALIELYTDEGLVGIGDALANVENSLGSVERVEAILKKMVGRSPWEFLLDDSIGGALIAVYDLVGQAAGLPVARLFSPKPRKRIVQTWWSQCLPPEVMASEAKLGVERGYKVHKVKARPFEDVIEQAEAITAVVPSDYRIWVDSNWTFGSVARAEYFIEKLSNFQQYFALESPMHRANIASYRQLRPQARLKIAEHIPADPMPFIREGLLDALVVGGPLGKTTVQRALMAEVTGVPLWIEHSILTGISQVFQAHQTAAFPGIEYAISICHVIQDDLMKEPFEMKNGRYTVPATPGLGVHLDDDAVEKYRRG